MNENFIDHLTLELEALKEDVSVISGDWNGDEPGIGEYRAHCAEDIIRLADELIEEIKYMQDMDMPDCYYGLLNYSIGRDEWQPMLDKLTIVKS